jgi:hypothetical protein
VGISDIDVGAAEIATGFALYDVHKILPRRPIDIILKPSYACRGVKKTAFKTDQNHLQKIVILPVENAEKSVERHSLTCHNR